MAKASEANYRAQISADLEKIDELARLLGVSEEHLGEHRKQQRGSEVAIVDSQERARIANTERRWLSECVRAEKVRVSAHVEGLKQDLVHAKKTATNQGVELARLTEVHRNHVSLAEGDYHRMQMQIADLTTALEVSRARGSSTEGNLRNEPTEPDIKRTARDTAEKERDHARITDLEIELAQRALDDQHGHRTLQEARAEGESLVTALKDAQKQRADAVRQKLEALSDVRKKEAELAEFKRVSVASCDSCVSRIPELER